MATFLGIHEKGSSMTDEQMQTIWTGYQAACDKAGCKALHVHYSADKGRAFCLTEADSIDQVQQAHAGATVPLLEILKVKNLVKE